VNKKTNPAISPAVALAAHEAAIAEAMTTAFVVVGTELDAIRTDKSYKAAHPTFEVYCQERWGFTASRARQLIRAAKSVTAGNASGQTEREVRGMLAAGTREIPENPKTVLQTAETEVALDRLLEELWKETRFDGRVAPEKWAPVRERAVGYLRDLFDRGLPEETFLAVLRKAERTAQAADFRAEQTAAIAVVLLDMQEHLDEMRRRQAEEERQAMKEAWEATATPEQLALRDEKAAKNKARKRAK
jgi:hypothetical protein